MGAFSTQSISPPGTGRQSLGTSQLHQVPSTRHRVTKHWSTRHRVTYQQSTKHQATRHRSKGHWAIYHWATRHRATRQPVTGHLIPVTSHRLSKHLSSSSDYQALGTSHWAFNHQAPVTGQLVTRHQSFYQAPVFRQQILSTEYWESSHTHKSSEHSLVNEPQNLGSSQRLLLPLEPDFNAMLDPSVIIDPPANTWQSPIKQTSQARQSRRDQPKPKHKSKKRRR